ncbi:glycosyltransferase family 39 protein [Candidatus Woesearchaeota archaeon]|nr:glycosyltransferase family 39 protein [Candidatus Woesearchaeota archaeon]
MAARRKTRGSDSWPERLVERAKAHPLETVLVAVLLAISIVIRVHLSLTTPLYPGNTDPVAYDRMATQALDDDPDTGIKSIYWPPGYPFFVVPFYLLFGKTFVTAKILNTAISLLNAGIIYYLGRKLFNHAIGLMGFAWMLFDPLMTFYATNMYTEPLFIALSAGSMALMLWQQEESRWWKPAATGVMIGYAALIKPWVLALAGIIVAWWLLNDERWKQHLKTIMTWTGILAAGIVLALTPWTIHNARTVGEFVPVPVNGPLNVYLGNHEHGTLAFTSDWPEESTAPFEGMGEYEKAQAAKRLAREYIKADVGGFISRVSQRFFKYWSHPSPEWFQRLIPHQDRLMAYLWVKAGLAIIGVIYSLKAWRKHSASYLWYGLMAGVFTMSLYLARHKVPLYPLQFLYAAAGILVLYNAAKQLFTNTQGEAS